MKKTLLCATLAVVALLGTSSQLQAQSGNRWCATDEHNAELARTFHDPQLAAQRAGADKLAERLQADDAFARQFRAQNRSLAASRVVPVVVHVVTRCGQESLPKAGIEAGLAQLNADWSRTNADASQTRPQFLPYAANLDVEFRFAKLDPDGNPFDGIHRVTELATDAINPRDLIKTAVPSWEGYFNVWIVDEIYSAPASGGTILGYAQFPGTGPWTTWGLVMRYDDWTANPLSNGRTAAHEMGHCFNLFHSFTDGGGCGSGCTSTGDRVCDTPPSASSYEPCYRTNPRNTCSNDVGTGSPYTANVPDQDENFMSYNNCQNMFTLGQKARVDAAIASFPYLQNLISPANLTRTGVATGQSVPVPGPVAYLSTCPLVTQGNELVVCAGRPVTFNDASYGATITGVSWTFTGATPATSTDVSPTVTFTTPGRQTVTLTASGGAGTGASTTLRVRVLPVGQYVAPLTESFEGGRQLLDSTWRVTSSSYTSSRRWQLVPAVTTDGDTAISISGNVPGGTVSTLYSPPFDVRNLATSSPAPTISYDIAYARRSSSTTSLDRLQVALSANCGQTWFIKGSFEGAALATNGGGLVTNFTPSSASQWRTETIILNGQFINQPSVLVRFQATAATGASTSNNIYLDNIRLNGRPLGVAQELLAAGVSLAPNPLMPETGLAFSLTHPTRVALRVSDLLGRPVLTDDVRTLAPGAHQLPLAARLRGAAAGVYVVLLELDGRVYSQKLLIQ